MAAALGLIMAFLLGLPSPSLAAGELARAREARDRFLENPSGHKRGEWTALVKRFEEAAVVQPKAEFAAKARFEGAQLSWRSYGRFGIEADAAKTLEMARAVIKGCPSCSDVPAARVLVGRALMARNQPEEAYRELMKVGLSHQGAPEVAEAEGLMAELSGGRLPAGSRTPAPPGASSGASASSASPAPSQSSPVEAPPAKAGRPRPSSPCHLGGSFCPRPA
jgi:hypothetical protein